MQAGMPGDTAGANNGRTIRGEMRSDDPEHVHVKHAQKPQMSTPQLAIKQHGQASSFIPPKFSHPLLFLFFIFLCWGPCVCHRVFGVTGGSVLAHIMRD